jgi:hypothetical protein
MPDQKKQKMSYERVRKITAMHDTFRYAESRCNDPMIEDHVELLIDQLEWAMRLGIIKGEEIEEYELFRKFWQSTGR